MKKLGPFFALIALLALVSCSPGPSKKLKIVVTTDFVADMVKGIAGPDLAEIEVLIKPGLNPHTTELSPFPTEKVTAADLIFSNGLVLEDKLILPLRDAAGSKLVEICETLSPTSVISTREGRDPHVWQEPGTWVLAGKVVMDKLAELRPDQKGALLARYQYWTDQATVAQRKAERILEAVSHDRRVIITMHPAYRYFARQFSFEAMTYEEAKAKKFSLPHFTSAEFELNSTGELVHKMGDPPSGNADVEPLGSDTLLTSDLKLQTYPEWVVHNATLIAKGLRK